jgi:hypothetical protein
LGGKNENLSCQLPRDRDFDVLPPTINNLVLVTFASPSPIIAQYLKVAPERTYTWQSTSRSWSVFSSGRQCAIHASHLAIISTKLSTAGQEVWRAEDIQTISAERKLLIRGRSASLNLKSEDCEDFSTPRASECEGISRVPGLNEP